MNLLDAAYALGAAVAAPWWMRKARGDWPARFGRTDALGLPPGGRKRVLVHAVSVGEVNAIRELVPELARRGVEVVVSVGTDTGIARARELFAGAGSGQQGRLARVVRYPVDFSRAVRRFLDAVRPDAVALVELEVWPNFVGECRRRGVPVCVINGRLSERSFRGYKRVRAFIGRSFRSLARVGVQDEAYRDRFVAMGVPTDRCVVTGSMKWDAAAIADRVPGADELAAAMGINRSRPLIVAGSTGPLGAGSGGDSGEGGEEAMLHRACPAGVQLLCAPRKPERFDAARHAMPGCTVRSYGEGKAVVVERGAAGSDRFLLATIGELRAAYSLADVVVVGRSFGDLYGSDPIEPVSLGKAVVIGPAVKDFESIVGELERAGGIVRATIADLGATLNELLNDPPRRRELAERGRGCIRSHQGATLRHADLIMAVLKAGPGVRVQPVDPEAH
ncbi:MAG: glycosyltransferase [Phycisphaeraceae bacterium]|nr:glycosyltransferase [Phycisphaeraceae bacterium]